jgi:hypothetical protein
MIAAPKQLSSLPSWISIDLSIQNCGNDPRALIKGSHKKVIRICEQCSKESILEFRAALQSHRCNYCIICKDGKEKTCRLCKAIKPIENFPVRHNRRKGIGVAYRSHCIPCSTQYRKKIRQKQFELDPVAEENYKQRQASNHRKRMQIPENKNNFKLLIRSLKKDFKSYVNTYLSTHPCVDCGEKDFEVLSFDHIKGKKSFNIGDLNGSPAHYKRFDEEVQKCEVRCLNCHQAISRKRRRDRLYCFLYDVEFTFTPKKQRTLPKNPTRSQVWRSKNFKRIQRGYHEKRNQYYGKYLPKFVKILEQGCKDCKTKNLLSMQFDHLPQFEKKNKVSELFFCWQRPWKEVLEEIKKCELICANCHRKRTNTRLWQAK